MEEFGAWIIDNKQWLFSGAGFAGFGAIAWIARFIFKKKYATDSQTIRSGDSSINVQAGRDVIIGRTKQESDVEGE